MTFYGVWKWKWKGGNGPDCGFKRCTTGKHQLDWARSYYCVLTLKILMKRCIFFICIAVLSRRHLEGADWE